MSTELTPENVIFDYFTKDADGHLYFLGRGTAAELAPLNVFCEAAGYSCSVLLPLTADGKQALSTPLVVTMAAALKAPG